MHHPRLLEDVFTGQRIGLDSEGPQGCVAQRHRQPEASSKARQARF